MQHTLSMSIRGDLPETPDKELVQIKDKEDAYTAQIYFNMGHLLAMPNDKRVLICGMLIKQSEAVGVEALPAWHEVINNPDLYDHLADQRAKGILTV